MKVSARIKDIITLNTDDGNMENQPMVEITLAITKGGANEETEIKFTEMLSNLSDLSSSEVAEYMSKVIKEYIMVALKGQKDLDEKKEWKAKDRLLNQKYTFDFNDL